MSTAPPDVAALLIRGAREAINLGSFDIAETLCQQGLTLAPGNDQLALLLGRVKFIKKDYATARDLLARAMQANPGDAHGWLLLGQACARTQGWTQAAQAYLRSFALKAPTAAEEAELGHVYKTAGDFVAAADRFARATALDPGSVALWNDLGSMQIEADDLAGAHRSFARALALEAAAAAPLRNLALLREMEDDFPGALAIYDQLLKQDPADAAIRQKRGATRLAHGQLVEGWVDYRSRFVNPTHQGWHGGIPKPRWDGDLAPLAEKGVLLWSDQGLGDQILVASLLDDLSAASRRVVFACEPRLIPLIARSHPRVRVVSLMDIPSGKVDLADVDVQLSISEAGPLLRPSFDRFPSRRGYLKADPARVAALKARYAALPGEGPVVGLSWHSVNVLAAGHKSVDLAQWAPILSLPRARFVCLQYGDAAAAARGTRVHIDASVDAVADVDLFAAQVAAMDRVVSTSNTTVHMAGALGVPTLCLTPRLEGRPWYWFVGHDVSPWYPSVRHLWQGRRRRWDDVIARAAEDLAR